MLSVDPTPRFERSYAQLATEITLHFLTDDVLTGFDEAFCEALLNVRTIPLAYPRTPRGRRRFFFTYKSVPYTVLFSLKDGTVMLLDIHYARSAKTARWLGGPSST